MAFKKMKRVKMKMKMTLLDMAKKIQKENPKSFEKMNEKRIAMLLKAAFEQIKTTIESEKDDKIQIQGFGQFNIRQIKFEKDGKNISKRRIVFTPGKKNS